MPNEKPVTIVVPQSQGALADRLTRALATPLARTLGRPVAVENKPGAQGVAGSEYVALQRPADGDTMLMTSLTNMSSFAVMVKDRRFDPLTDLTPVMGFADTKLFLGSSPTHPWRSFDELIAHARANAGRLSYGASSTSNRLQTALMLAAKGVSAIYKPFEATAAYQQSIADGATHMGLMPEPASIGWGPRIHYTAQTGERRSPSFPNAPTFAELGLPHIKGVTYTLNVRAGTPPTAIEALNAAVTQALADPETAAWYRQNTLEILRQTPAQAAANLAGHARFLADMAGREGVSA